MARELGLDHSVSGVSPEGKLELVRAERRAGPVMMIGDGVNDAPALTLADVGLALVDRIDRNRRSRRDRAALPA